MKIIVYCDIMSCILVEWKAPAFGRNLLFPFCTTKREMGSSSEKFVPFYKTGDVTSRNPVILTTTSVTTLNLTVSITIVGENLHFKSLGGSSPLCANYNISVDKVGRSKHNKTLLRYRSPISYKVLLCFDLPTLSIEILHFKFLW
jgi:hypothetical protein